MNILYVHRAFPSQFAPLALALRRHAGWESMFLSLEPDGQFEGLTNLQYRGPESGDRRWEVAFSQQLQHSLGVLDAVRRHRLRPDLVVAHAGTGGSHLLPGYLECPVINYFEYYTRALSNDILERREWRFPSWYYQWRRTANAMAMLDLECCTGGYSPTKWQRETFPESYRHKIEVIFDGVDTAIFRPRPARVERRFGDLSFGPDTRVVTYVSRGLEAVRGFDRFLQLARRIYLERPDTVFLVAGRDRVCYGPDCQLLGTDSFKEWALAQDDYDRNKFVFLDWISIEDLVQLFHLSDLHLYLSTPFVPSWSLFNALACGSTVLAAKTDAVREIIRHGENGLLADFEDLDALTALSLAVLSEPSSFASLGECAVADIHERYAMEVVVPRFMQYFSTIASG